MKKLVFANQLRGIAAILVVMTHYFGTYFAEQQLLAERTFSPDFHFMPSRWVHAFELAYQGPFGVAIFFLISGLVIPFSLSQTTRGGFLLNRLFRIFPTYLCCLAIGLASIYGGSLYWGQTFAMDRLTLVSNALLAHNLVGVPSLDSVNWTLAIEIKFYLLAALLAPALLRKNALWLLCVLVLAPFYTFSYQHAFSANAHFNTVLVALAMDMNYVVFMLIGTMFYHHLMNMISTRMLLLRSAALLGIFCLDWSIGPQQAQFPSITLFYVCALAVFAACYAIRARFSPVALLDFFADISYPLYTVHTLLGYSVMKILMKNGLPFGAAVVLTLTLAVCVAWLVHISIESASLRYGKRLSARFSPVKKMATQAPLVKAPLA